MPLYHLLFPHFIQTTNRAPLFRTPSRSPFLRKPYRDIPETTPVRLLFDLAHGLILQRAGANVVSFLLDGVEL